MQVRKFEAPTMNEALQIVKQELGPDAIILSTKNHRKGFGLLSKASVEITAAVSEKSLQKKQITERVVPAPQKEQIKKLPAEKQANIYEGVTQYYSDKAKHLADEKRRREDAARGNRGNRYIDIMDEEEQVMEAPSDGAATSGYGRNGRVPGMAASPTAPAPVSHGSGATAAARPTMVYPEYPAYSDESESNANSHPAPAMAAEEIDALRNDVRRLKAMMEEIKTEQAASVDARLIENGSESLNVEFQNLVRNGIDRKFAAHLMKQVAFALPRNVLNDPNQAPARITEAVAVEMMENIRVENLIAFQPGGEQRVLAVVGPTGVGKTTTIAKMASHAILQKNLRVGLINLDTYKVGASDQLATYAKILNVPYRHASNEQELERALTEFKPLDLVIIDTTGRSQKDNESLLAMKNLLGGAGNVQNVLILSATTRDQELYDILNRFKIFSPTSLVFSKLDETSVFGCIYNLAIKTGLPLAYFTVGQRVPEDIEIASKERVVDLVLDLTRDLGN